MEVIKRKCAAHTRRALTITEEKLNTTPFSQHAIPLCVCAFAILFCWHEALCAFLCFHESHIVKIQGLSVWVGAGSVNALLYATCARVGGFHLWLRTGKTLTPTRLITLRAPGEQTALTLYNIFNDRNSLFCHCRRAFTLSDSQLFNAQGNGYLYFPHLHPMCGAKIIILFCGLTCELKRVTVFCCSYIGGSHSQSARLCWKLHAHSIYVTPRCIDLYNGVGCCDFDEIN